MCTYWSVYRKQNLVVIDALVSAVTISHWGPCRGSIKTWPLSNNFIKFWSISRILGAQNLQRVSNVYMCSLQIMTKQSTSFIGRFHSSLFTLHVKKGPLRYCNKIFNKSCNVQPFSMKLFKEDMNASIITANVRNGVQLHGHKPGDVVSIHW